MITLTLVGAGGKMGCRLTDNFLKTQYRLHYLEVSPKGLENLKQRGVATSDAETAIPESDVVILAVPDVAIGAVARDVVPRMKPGALLMTLDPAAPLDNQLPRREDGQVLRVLRVSVATPGSSANDCGSAEPTTRRGGRPWGPPARPAGPGSSRRPARRGPGAAARGRR